MADPRFGPVPLWWWDAEQVTPERIRWQMEALRRGGLRNLCIINLAPAGPNAGSRGSLPSFYDESWWECFDTAVRTAERLHMFLWYYDQIGFSGANFPAQVASAHPEFRGFQLRRWKTPAAGPEPSAWLKAGEWTYGVERGGFDWTNPRAAAALLDRIHGEMERRFGRWLGSVIVGSFQDELPPMPTWSGQLLAQYAERYNEALETDLPRLFGDEDASKRTALVRRRVYALLGEMVETAFFRPLGEWHRRHHLLLGCDQAGPGREVDPYGAQRLYLDYPRTHRWFSAPGNDPDGEIKPHASIAHQWQGGRVWLEAFHSSGWGGTLEDTLHWLLPWYQAGATLYNPHAIYFSTVGGWWEWAAPDTGWRQPYFEHYPVFADTVARLSKALSMGHHVADIAVYYPGRALWSSMAWPSGATPPHPMALAREHTHARLSAISQPYWDLIGRQNRLRPELGALREARWDFDTIDDLGLMAATFDTTGIQIAQETYRVLVFAGTEQMDAENQVTVQRWVDRGGLAIGVGVPEDERRIRGAVEIAMASEIGDILEQRLTRRVQGPGQALIRQYDQESTLFFLMPPEGALAPMHETVDLSRPVPTTVDYWIQATGQAELWNPVTGETEPLSAVVERDGLRMAVPLTAWPAALVMVHHRSHTPHPGARVVPQEETEPPYPAHTGSEPTGTATRLSDGGWTIRVEPTLDNRYHDFDRHTDQAWVQVEIRRVEVAPDPSDVGGDQAWYQPGSDATTWTSRLWSEAAYWKETGGPSALSALVYSTRLGDLSFRSWDGRMARIPRTFMNLGDLAPGARRRVQSFASVPETGRYWLQVEGDGAKTVLVDSVPRLLDVTRYGAKAAVELSAGWSSVEVEVKALHPGPMRLGVAIGTHEPAAYPEWVQGAAGQRGYSTHVRLPDTFHTAQLHLVVMDGVADLEVNGSHRLHLGDYMPYSHWGQQACDASLWLHPGDNVVRLRWIDDPHTVRAFLEGTWTDADGAVHPWECSPWLSDDGRPSEPVALSTEAHWLVPRPHLLPDIGWLQPQAVPQGLLTWSIDPSAVGHPVWIRCTLPVGARQITLNVAGRVEAWVDGQAVAVRHGRLDLIPGPAGRVLVCRVIPQGLEREASVLKAPIVVGTAAAPGYLGTWSGALGLHTYSGAVEYEREVGGQGQSAVLDLGAVRGTAEVWVDGWNAGVRLWHPYRFDLSPAWGNGRRRIRIRVTNTLGAFYADGKPTDFCPVPQQASGLLGPVTLRED